MFKNYETTSHEICNRKFNNFHPCHEAAWIEQIDYTSQNTRSHFSGPYSIRSILSRSSNSELGVYAGNDRLEYPVRDQNSSDHFFPSFSYSPLFYKEGTHTKANVDEIEPCSSRFCTPANSSRWFLEKNVKQRDDSDKKLSKKNNKRTRTIFTPNQLQRLEKEFSGQQYVAGEERKELAAELQLSETQVKVWFQNRRIRFRKQNRRVLKSPEITRPLHTSDQHKNSPY